MAVNNIIDQLFFDEVPNTNDFLNNCDKELCNSENFNLIEFSDVNFTTMNDNTANDNTVIAKLNNFFEFNNNNNNLDKKNETSNDICNSIIKGIELLLDEDDDTSYENVNSIKERNINNNFNPVIARPKMLKQNNENKIIIKDDIYNVENKENYLFPMEGTSSGFSNRTNRRKMLLNNGNSTIKKLNKTVPEYCVFCSNNGQPEYVYKTHKIRDCFGRIICPKLRDYKCPICGISGDNAHTTKYCPQKPVFTMEDAKYIHATRARKLI